MKLFIPEIGVKLKLTKPWNFVLYAEHRNQKLMTLLGKKFDWHKRDECYSVTIPTDTVLTVDRIYIRKGSSGFSSITFNISKPLNKGHKYAGSRFWASLADVNEIEFDLLECNEETLSVLKNYHDVTKELVTDSQLHATVMKTVLNGASINNIRPNSEPYTFLREAKERLKQIDFSKIYFYNRDESSKIEIEKCVTVMEVEMRKYKIKSLLEEIENDENKKQED